MENERRLRVLCSFVAAGCLLAVTPRLALGQTAEPAPVATPTAVAAPVPLDEVPVRAREAGSLLRDIEESLQALPEIEEIKQRLPELRTQMNELQLDAVKLLGDSPSRATLDGLQVSWVEAGRTLEAWQATLTTRIREVEGLLERAREMRRTWEATRDAARQQAAPAAIVELATKSLTDIRQTRKRLEGVRDVLLLLQDQVAELLARKAAVQREIDRLRLQNVTQLRERDSLRLWEIQWSAVASGDVAVQVAESLSRQALALWQYVVANAAYVVLHALIFGCLVPLLTMIRQRLPGWVERNPQVLKATPVFELPASSAFLASTVAALWIYPAPPRVFSQLLALAALLPTVHILRRLIDNSLLPVVHAFAAFFVFDRLRRLIDISPEAGQVLFILQMAIGIGAILWLVSTGRMSLTQYSRGAAVGRMLEYAARALIAVFAFSLVAATLGYMRLAEWLGSGFLTSGYVAIGLYASYRVVQGLIGFALRSPVVGLVKLTQQPMVERRIYQALHWAAWATWVSITLSTLDLLVPLSSGLRTALAAEIAVGEIRLSLGDLVAFAVTVWLSFALSRFVRFVLREDVFPRLEVARGVPYAVSTLVHYGFLLVGFFLAFAAMGLDLNRFTILAGAFGVGIGFGMQNIINNFVSGIILLFERPVQVGDTVQLGEIIGEVQRIGIRSSAIRTAQGSEVVVPNASLISEVVTNWTLSDRLRRIDVNVGVAYGTDPERVLELLRQVATNHALVLTEPPAVALFLAFGESSLDFELRVWTSRFNEWVRIRSELNVAVNAALRDANIEIPFPQRSLHFDLRKAVDVRIVEK